MSSFNDDVSDYMTADEEEETEKEDDDTTLQRCVKDDLTKKSRKDERSLERSEEDAGCGIRQLALLKELKKKNDYRELLSELQDKNINVLHESFFCIFDESSACSSDDDEENGHVFPDILFLLKMKMMHLTTVDLTASVQLDIVGNCLAFIDLGIKWIGKNSQCFCEIISSVLHVLHLAMKKDINKFASDVRLESLLTQMENHNPEPRSIFLISKAAMFLTKYPEDHAKLRAALQMIDDASHLPTRNVDIQDQCFILKNKINGKLRATDSASLSQNATPERKASRKRDKRMVKKRTVDEGKDSSDQGNMNGAGTDTAEKSIFNVEVNVGGEISDSAKKAFNNFSIAQFMEEFNLVPFDASSVYNFIKDHNLSALSPTESPLLEALWSVIQKQSWMQTRWRLENISFEEFAQRFHQRVNADVSEPTTLQLLNLVADEYLVKILVFSLLSPLIPILKILPSKASHTHCLHLLHTRKGRFFGLGSGDDLQLPNSTTFSHSSRGGSQAVEKVSQNIALLVEQVSHLETRAEEVIVEGRNHRKNIFRMLTRPELEEKVSSRPADHWVCKLRLQGPHEGIAEPLIDRKTAARDAPPEASILLRGRRSCGIAFDGDEVVVEVFRNQGRVESGRVLGVWSSNVRPVNQVFFCKVSSESGSACVDPL